MERESLTEQKAAVSLALTQREKDSSRSLDESQERRSAPRAELVDVAAAVAHEVANAVGAIAGWAELGLSTDTAANVDPRQALSLIASCARSAEQAARRLLTLARGNDDDVLGETLDVSELSGELLQLLAITGRQARVSLCTQIEPGLNVTGSRGQWFTILWNLVKNAIEASPAGATVSIQLEGDDAHVHLEVRDAGPGLDAAAQARIFTPYFTSKARGTGLGLPLVRQSLNTLGGHLTIESSPGSGSLFRASLPRAGRQSSVTVAEDPRGADSEEAPKAVGVVDARILVVDDDDALREMVGTALSLRGGRVVTARGASEAKAQSGSFDIALIDMNLSDCRGDELLAHLRQQGTVNAAMLVTGTAQCPRLVPGGEPDDWLRKPFEISQLVERLKRTLERHRMLHAAAASMRR